MQILPLRAREDSLENDHYRSIPISFEGNIKLETLIVSLLCLVSVFAGTLVVADLQSSASIRIEWDMADAGGIVLSSTNFTVEGSPAQAGLIGESSSSSDRIVSGFYSPPDTDSDRARDFLDNCTLDPNSSQLDTDNDGFGNFCDPDLDNSGAVDFVDYVQMTTVFLSTPASPNWNANADLNGDNIVNFIDIARFQLFFLGKPGPSGIN